MICLAGQHKAPYPTFPRLLRGSNDAAILACSRLFRLCVTVNKAVLTVTANNLSSPRGAPLPVLTATITGFVNGDTAAVVGGAPALTTTATSSSPEGAYPITAAAGTLAAANYTFVFVNGTLTITGPIEEPNSVPVLSGITPSETTTRSTDLTITLAGTSFVSGPVARIGSTSLVTTFQNENSLSATIPASFVSSVGVLPR